MVVAKVVTCEKVQKSDKLLKFDLDIGTEHRTVLSGIAKYYQPEELIGKSLILLANLKPRKIMGVLSEGMLLSAITETDGVETLRLLTVDSVMPAGSEVG